MFHEIINEKVDIYTLPAADLKDKENSEITIGDLHGNAMKLLFMLVKHGIATNISEKKYLALVKIYTTPAAELKKKHLKTFNSTLANMKFSTQSTIRLLGDELADRGSNDYFTLKILEKLKGCKLEIILSNHSVEFIEAYEAYKKPSMFSKKTSSPLKFERTMLEDYHVTSMRNIQTLLTRKLVKSSEILKIIKKAYKPVLKAISYSLDKNEEEITIYSHAAIGLETIKELTKKFNVAYNDDTAKKLAQTIDSINVKYQKHVKKNTVHTLYTSENMEKGYNSAKADLSGAPVEFIMWNRRYDKINRPATHPDHAYKIHFAHGHDTPPENTVNNAYVDHIYNLDNQLGKETQHTGHYTVLCTQPDVAIQQQETSLPSALSNTPTNESNVNNSHTSSEPYKNKMSKKMLQSTNDWDRRKEARMKELQASLEQEKIKWEGMTNNSLNSLRPYLTEDGFEDLKSTITRAFPNTPTQNIQEAMGRSKEAENTYLFVEITALLLKSEHSLKVDLNELRSKIQNKFMGKDLNLQDFEDTLKVLEKTKDNRLVEETKGKHLFDEEINSIFAPCISFIDEEEKKLKLKNNFFSEINKILLQLSPQRNDAEIKELETVINYLSDLKKEETPYLTKVVFDNIISYLLAPKFSKQSLDKQDLTELLKYVKEVKNYYFHGKICTILREKAPYLDGVVFGNIISRLWTKFANKSLAQQDLIGFSNSINTAVSKIVTSMNVSNNKSAFYQPCSTGLNMAPSNRDGLPLQIRVN
ncbi:MAG: Dot/Icm T4SS effector Wip [Candidatus Aquirickettsiella sp.]